MKKIIASVLAAASVLSVSATAFAASDTKDVTKTGDITYDVSATAPKVTLKLVMPAKMAASLNPYGADIKLDKEGKNTLKTGIASTAYEIINKTTDYGIAIDAKAITTVTTTDTTTWKVSATNVEDGTKAANMAFMSFKDAAAMAADASWADASAAADDDLDAQGGILVLDSDQTSGTEQEGIVKLGAAANATTPASCVVGFVGVLAKSSTGKDAKKVTWNEDDAINVNLVLKVNVGPKAATP